jgi:predicted nucleotidyltransferase
VSTDSIEFDPQQILDVLDRHRVEYVIVGGFGSQVHGALRQTYDLDVVSSTAADNAERLASALRDLNARLRVAGMTDEEARQLPVIIDAETIRAFGSTTWNTDAGPLDVLHDLPVADGGRPYEELNLRGINYVLSGIAVRVASLKDIIDSKTHANRPKDREALPELHRYGHDDQTRRAQRETPIPIDADRPSIPHDSGRPELGCRPWAHHRTVEHEKAVVNVGVNA